MTPKHPTIRDWVIALDRVRLNMLRGRPVSNQDLTDLAIVIRDLEELEEKFARAFGGGRS